MSEMETQAAIDVPQQETKQEKIKKAYRYPEKLRPFVHPKLSFAAICCIAVFVYTAICKIVYAATLEISYVLPLTGFVLCVLASIIAPFVGKRVTGRWNISDWAMPAILAVSFVYDVMAAAGSFPGMGSAPEYWPEITRVITFDGYSILVQYPVADNFELSGETLVNHAPMPTMLVSAALAVLFVVIPSLVVTRNESGSEAEEKALRRVSIAQAVALGVMIAAFAIFFLVTWFD